MKERKQGERENKCQNNAKKIKKIHLETWKVKRTNKTLLYSLLI